MRALGGVLLGFAFSASGLWVLRALVVGERHGHHGAVYCFADMPWLLELLVRGVVTVLGTVHLLLGVGLARVLFERAFRGPGR